MKIRNLISTGEWTTRRYLSLLGTVVIWIIVAIDAWYLWPTQLGGSTSIVIVSGSSMEPTFFGGDLVIARKMDPSVGDVIVYAPQGLGGSQIVHRITGGDAEDGWQMQGDNNNFVDPFTPQGDEIKGVVLVHYSNFGRVTVLLLNPMVWAFVLLAAIVLLLWYGDDCEDDDDDDDDQAPADEDSPEGDEGADSQDSDPPPHGTAVGGSEDAPADADARASGAPTEGAVMRTADGGRGSLVRAVPVRLGAFFGALLLTFGIGVGPASASQLVVNASEQVSATAYHKCAQQTLSASTSGEHTGNNYSEITVSGMSQACAGLPMEVYLHRTNGALEATLSGTSAQGPTTLIADETFHGVQVSSVIVKIGGWLFLATWTVSSDVPTDPAVGTCQGYFMTTGQIPSGTQCVLTTSTGGLETLPVGNGGPGHFRRINLTTNFSPSGYSENNSYVGEYAALTLWRITLNLTAPAYGTEIDFAGGYYVYNMNNAAMAVGEDCSDPTSVTFQERNASSGQGADIVVSDAPIGYWSYALMCSSP